MKNFIIISKTRIIVIYIGLFAMVGILIVRTGYLYFNEVDDYSKHGLKRSMKAVIVPASKGMIKDRNGEILAATIVLYNLIVDLNHLRIKSQQSTSQTKLTNRRIDKFKAKMTQLAKLLKQPVESIREKVFLQNPRKMQGYLAKDLLPEVVNRIKNLQIPALVFERKLKRYYPHGETLAHVIGFSDYINIGRSGVEQSYDNYMRGQSGKMWLRRDRVGGVTSYVAGDGEFKRGKDLTLTIDVKIQNLAFLALQQAIEKYKAENGAVVVLKVKTGDILAMASFPSYDTNDNKQLGINLSNIASQELFELGSIIKPFIVLAGLENNVINKKTTLYLGTNHPKHKIKIGPHTFKDSADLEQDTINIATMLKKSSNVGAIRLAQKIDDQAILAMLQKVGFGVPSNIGLYGGKLTGIVPKKLNSTSKASLSIGYGINANVLQMARAYSVLANDGKLVQTRLSFNQAIKSQQVVKKQTVKQVNKWLLSVSSKNGTAPLAKIDGFNVVGKTGTTLISNGSLGYKKNQYIASFIGFAPYKKPEIIVAVLIRKPKGKRYYGGEIAAPVFSEVTTNTLNYLGVRSAKQHSLVKMLDKGKVSL